MTQIFGNAAITAITDGLSERTLIEIAKLVRPGMVVKPTHGIVTTEGIALKARMDAEAERRRLRNRRKREARKL